MPPEPLPWNRKDFFKERKHKRSESMGSIARWRDSSYHSSRDFSGWGPADFRRPPGYGKQGGWHLFSDDSGHGYALSRCNDKILEEESCPLLVARDGKYCRSSRENRSFNQRDWRGHSWETTNGSVNLSRRVLDVTSDQRSVDDILTYPSHPQSDLANIWDPYGMREQHDKMGINGLGTGQRCDWESSLGSIDWRPLKWTRMGSLSSRGSGFSNPSSLRSLDAVDSNEIKTELLPKNATAIESHSIDAAACVTSAVASEDTNSRKKPRLNWGEGLAKYEKKKVVGTDVSVIKDGPILFASNMESCCFLGSGLADKRLKVTGFSDCASPVTPSSVACSSSPGVDDKVDGKAASDDNDVCDMSVSPDSGPQNHVQRFPFNLEKLDIDSLTSLGSSLIELLQSDDLSSVDFGLVTSTAMNKLLIWKTDISKVLEVTETEIDSLENEMKYLKYESGIHNAKSCEEHAQVTYTLSRSVPLQVVSSANTDVEKMPLSIKLHSVHVNGQEEDVDSPGSATSKFIEPSSLFKAISQCNRVGHDNCSGDLDVGESASMKCLVPCCISEEASASGCGDGSMSGEAKDDMGATSGANLCSGIDNALYNTIMASNKDSANSACKVFDKLLPEDCCKIGSTRATSDLCTSSDILVKEKVAERKQFAKFKERVMTIKYKAFQHLWKEDMHLFSIRKYCPKSHKKPEVALRTTNGSYQKHQSSIHSRFACPAGNLILVPTSETVNFTSKLLLDSLVKVHRSTLKMPALILDEKEKMSSFISSNGLVEDPLAFEKERAMINPWTLKEKEVFFEKLAACGKDFRKIASFLDHKTTADCVEFYYKNHKADDFEKIKRKHSVDKVGKLFPTSTDLAVSGKKWSHEMNASSLEILSAASVVAGHADGITGNQKMHKGSFLLEAYGKIKTSKCEDNVLQRSRCFDMLADERETVAADVLAGICGSLSSEALSSCITSSVDPTECNRDRKCLQVNLVSRQPLTPDVTQNVDDGTCSDESCGEMDPTDWTDEEKSAFLQAVSSFGKDFLMISQSVRTRSQDQCKVFFSKAHKCLELDLVRPRPENVGSPVNDDANGDGSDTEDACVVETVSVTGIDKAGTKTDGDIPLSATNTFHNESNPVEARDMSTGLNESKDVDHGTEVGNEDMDNMVSDFCDMKDMSNLGSGGDGNVLYSTEKSGCVCCQTAIILSASMYVGEDKANILADADNEVSAEEIIRRGQVNCVAEDKALSKDSAGGLENEVEGQDLLLPRCLGDRDDKDEVDTGVVELKSSLSSTALNASLLSLDNSCEGLSVNTEIRHQASTGNSHFPALVREISHSSTTSLPDGGSIECEKMANQDQLLSCDSRDSRDRKCHISSINDDQRHHMSGHPLDSVEPASILQGYPLQMPIKNEVNGDMICSRTTAELPLLSHKIEQTGDHSKTKSRHLLDSKKTSRNGDVKLFGKILTNPSSTPKLNLSTKGNEENTIHHLKLSTKASSLKCSGHHSADGNSTVLKFDHNMGLENVPLRSYGYWNGNRIQSGFSLLPDSSLLLAKYPTAFSNYPTSSARLEQQSLHAFGSSEQNLKGASSFTTWEHDSSNVGTAYQMFISRDGPKIRPFVVDMKPQQDAYSEMQRRNAVEAKSSLHQQGRGMVGLNGVGRPGIHVGGSRSGVSDPVAAIKMHFSNSGQYGGLTGSILRQDESWAGNGHLGR